MPSEVSGLMWEPWQFVHVRVGDASAGVGGSTAAPATRRAGGGSGGGKGNGGAAGVGN